MKRILVMLCAVALVFNSNAQEVSATYDPDGDNNIGVTDLLALLSLFSENDLDDDGIWDSQDDCVGEFDECGICNGDGLPCPCTSPVLFDDYQYNVVEIGDQCWFAENLRTEHYANGDVIPGELSNSEWQNTTEGAQAIDSNDASNLADYGRLYNWYAVDDARGLCPSGWHVPTDGEYTELTDFLGGLSIAGTQMKSSPSDDLAWDGTNTSGFSGLAGGYRSILGGFDQVGDGGYFWSSSPDGADAWSWALFSGYSGVNRYGYNLRFGFSVRCVRD